MDILILNAAQWLSGTLDDQSDTEIINTISSGLTGSILLTQALLPGLRRSESADIVSIISSCGIPNFTDSIAHPAFFASKHGLSGFTTKLSYQLSKENIRVTGLYPPDFELTGLEAFVDSQPKMGERLMNGRSVWETIRFVLTQPRNCHIRSIYFEGPTREKLAVRS
ncbi:SDR family oxidoreductase [Klebsiella pneumoniae]|nr:SDR family oxidoreductase [Klebsiella pneumoniae]